MEIQNEIAKRFFYLPRVYSEGLAISCSACPLTTYFYPMAEQKRAGELREALVQLGPVCYSYHNGLFLTFFSANLGCSSFKG